MLAVRAGDEVVDAHDLVAPVEQRVGEVRAEEAGTAGDDDAGHSDPPDAGCRRSRGGAATPGRGGCGRRRRAWRRALAPTLSKSSQRNSSHSVSTSERGGALARRVRIGDDLDALEQVGLPAVDLAVGRSTGRRRGSCAPAARSRSMISSAGESRRSSVRALNVSPHDAERHALDRAADELDGLRRRPGRTARR